jgi:hypothetical protein
MTETTGVSLRAGGIPTTSIHTHALRIGIGLCAFGMVLIAAGGYVSRRWSVRRPHAQRKQRIPRADADAEKADADADTAPDRVELEVELSTVC